MTRTRAALFALVMVAVAAPALRANDERLKDAATVLTEMTSSAASGIPVSLLSKARCVVVIPGVKKAALGFGGQYGRGYISCRNDTTAGWSAPGGIRIEGGSFGLQIGASDTDLVLAVLNDRGADRLLSSRFTVGADASVAAGPLGRQVGAQTDATMMAEILAWSRARGVYAGISLQGSTLREDSGENRELYGREIPNREIVLGDMSVPAVAAELVQTLAALE